MKKILVIDDDIEVLNVLRLVLTHNKYVVKTSWKWEVILQTIRTFVPDLIMLDIDLGGADGSEICKELKQLKETEHVPVILMSVHNMGKSYLKNCKAQSFLNKPFELTHLLKTLKNNLN